MSEDADLVLRVRAGDRTAYGDLYALHARTVRGVVRASVRDADRAEDVVQDVFVKALDKLPTLADPGRFRPWLLQITRNAVVDAARAGSRVVGLDDETAEQLPETGAGPDVLAEVSDLVSLVRGAVTGLRARDATALTLVTQLGFGPDEVAVALGVTPGAAKVVLHRARQRLREALVVELALRRAHGCPELGEDPVAAARHAATCPTCEAAATAEVALFDLRNHEEGSPVMTGMDSAHDPADTLLAKLRAFVAGLEPDERAMLAALLAPGVASAAEPEVVAFGMDDPAPWRPAALPDALAQALRAQGVRVVGLD